jgi:NAD(P)-dependent dehydrogenase (short-subunit alcohol dehydrogenase family)
MRDLARREPLDRAASAAGVAVDILQLDVTDPDSVERAVATARSNAPIDALVNNAGYQVWTPIEETTDTDVLQQFDTNVVGLVRVTRAVLPSMRERRTGVIVNLSSVVGITGSPYEGLYSATKHAVEALSESLYFEMKPFGVRVVVVQPGGYPTAFAENAVHGMNFDARSSPYAYGFERWTSTLERLTAGSPAHPEEVADTILAAVSAPQPKLYWPVGAEARLVSDLRRPVAFEDYEQKLRSTIDWWD